VVIKNNRLMRTIMSELTTTQKTILEAAIGHLNGSIHPLPAHINVRRCPEGDRFHRDGLSWHKIQDNF
jgi:hypothetical protein